MILKIINYKDINIENYTSKFTINFRENIYIYNFWRGGRVAEGARLESVYALIAYRGFESHSLRINLLIRNAMLN